MYLLIAAAILVVIMIVMATLTKRRLAAKHTRKANRPTTVDVVLVDRGHGLVDTQIQHVERYMPWVSRIMVVTGHQAYSSTKVRVVAVVVLGADTQPLETTLNQLVDQNRKKHRLADDILFLGDDVLPVHTTRLSDWWTPTGKKRVFSHKITTKDGTRVADTTVPVLVINIPQFKLATSLDRYLLMLELDGGAVYSPSMNATVIMTDNESIDRRQIQKATAKQAWFATLTVDPTLPEDRQLAMRQRLATFF